MPSAPPIHINRCWQGAALVVVAVATALLASPAGAQSSFGEQLSFGERRGATAFASDWSAYRSPFDWSSSDAPRVAAARRSYQLLNPHVSTPQPQPYANAPPPNSYAVGMNSLLEEFHAPPPEVVRGRHRPSRWSWQVLPDGLIYRSYLAGVREPRFAGVWNYERDLGWVWDIALGGRAGIIRYGTEGDFQPEGWQLDIEGAAFPRLDLEEESDMIATDFRFGVPLTYGVGRFQTKFAFYHLSSHLGDELLESNPALSRINFSRDVLVLGGGWFFTPALRGYAEAGYAVRSDVSQQWEFQFGLDYSPACPSGLRGAPFFAVNAHLREEVDYGGNFVAQLGWQWRGAGSGQLFRLGVQYFNGKSEQYEFITDSESKVGLGIWYDY
jgi:hypothetical protein